MIIHLSEENFAFYWMNLAEGCKDFVEPMMKGGVQGRNKIGRGSKCKVKGLGGRIIRNWLSQSLTLPVWLLQYSALSQT